MSETEMLGRLAAIEQLSVMAFAVVIAADRSSDAVQKGAAILRFALDDLAGDKSMKPEIQKEALAAFDEISSRASEVLQNLRGNTGGQSR